MTKYEVTATVYVHVDAENEEDAKDVAYDWIGIAEGHPDRINFSTLDIDRVEEF